MKRINKTTFLPIGLLFALLIVSSHQFCYMFNLGNAVNGPKVVTHTSNYGGSGGNTTIKVGINPSSSSLSAFRIPILNNILIWNLQVATQKNTKALASSSTYDIESVTLHELGHALGLGHTNLASESGLDHPDSEATAAYKGSDGTFNVNPGSDGVYGSSDDIRGDDLNFNYFNPSNNPFILATPTDKSIYKNNISYLPSGHKFATTGGIAESVSLVSKRDVEDFFEDLNVLNELAPVVSYDAHPIEVEEEVLDGEEIGEGVELGYQTICSEVLMSHPDRQKRIRSGSTEAIMQQGTYNGEYQRTLSADDVAALYYARAGVDETAGTSDDYRFNIIYTGESTGNDIDVYLDPSYTSVGVTSAGSKKLSGYHYSVSGATIRINPDINWFFNPLLATVIAFPSSQSQSIGSNAVMNLDLYFASAGPSSVSTSALTYTSSIGGSVSLNKIDGAHYSIQISGFSGSGTPCIQMSSTSLTDSKYSAKYEASNQLCFSVTSSGSQPSVAASPSPSASAAAASPSASNSPSKSPAAASQTASKSPAAASQTSSKSPAAASQTSSKSPAAASPSATKSPAASPSNVAASPSATKSNAAASQTSSKSPAAASPSATKSPAASPSNAAASPSATKSNAASASTASSPAASNSATKSVAPVPSNSPTATKSNTPASSTPTKSKAASSATPTKSKAASSPSATKSKSPSNDDSSHNWWSSSSSSESDNWWSSSSSSSQNWWGNSNHEVLAENAEEDNYVEYVEEPLLSQKRAIPNNFEKEVEEYIRVAENSGSILAQSFLFALPLIALLF